MGSFKASGEVESAHLYCAVLQRGWLSCACFICDIKGQTENGEYEWVYLSVLRRFPIYSTWFNCFSQLLQQHTSWNKRLTWSRLHHISATETQLYIFHSQNFKKHSLLQIFILISFTHFHTLSPWWNTQFQNTGLWNGTLVAGNWNDYLSN